MGWGEGLVVSKLTPESGIHHQVGCDLCECHAHTARVIERRSGRERERERERRERDMVCNGNTNRIGRTSNNP